MGASQLRDSPRISRGSLLVTVLQASGRAFNHGKMFMSKYLARTLLLLFTLQRYTYSSVPQNNVINKKPLKTPPATNCLITTYHPFYIASLLAYFAEKMYLCSVDISVGNGASRYQLGVLCD